MDSNYITKKNIYNRQPLGQIEYTRVPLWQLPNDKRYSRFDTDNSKWFESSNKYQTDEILEAETALNMNFSDYKIHTTITVYNDNIEKQHDYPNGVTVEEAINENLIIQKVKDGHNRLIAEKIFGKDSFDGRKLIYKNGMDSNNQFTVVKVFNYDTGKNKATDVVNYAFKQDDADLTKGCSFEKEFYLLNGKQVEAEKIGINTYKTKDEFGNKLIFKVK